MSAALALRTSGSRCHWTVGCLLVATLAARAADWPQYRGPDHNGVSLDRITRQWSGSVTNPVWLVPLANGLSTFAVSGGRAYTQVRRTIGGADKEVCVALNIANGLELWSATVGNASYPQGGVGPDDGPRSTPAIDSDSVYVLSSYLVLYRLNATNGAVVWSRDLVSLYGAQVISWQNAASPLVENGLIFLNASTGLGSLMALRTSDGSLAWRSQNEGLTHSTPVLATIHGVRQVVFATQKGLVSLNPQSGALLWKFTYPFSYSTSIGASPVVDDDLVFVCGAHAYGMGSVVMQANFTNNTWATRQLWFTNNPAAHWMTPVARQGFLYGQFGIQQFDSSNAQLKCIDMHTGAVRWSVNGFGRSGTLLVDDYLLALTETGSLVLAQADPNAYTEIGRFLAIPNFNQFTNRCWNSPAVCDGRVYVRSTGFAACFDLSVPGLKLDAPQLLPGQLLQLTIRTADGRPLDPTRLAGLEVRATMDLSLPVSDWPRLTNELLLANGVVTVTNVGSANETAARFFIGTEPR